MIKVECLLRNHEDLAEEVDLLERYVVSSRRGKYYITDAGPLFAPQAIYLNSGCLFRSSLGYVLGDGISLRFTMALAISSAAETPMMSGISS